MQKRSSVSKEGLVAAAMVLILLILLIAAAPVFSQNGETPPPENTDAEQGKTQGEFDARGNFLWFFPGLLLPGCGMVMPWLFAPEVPSDKLIGKSDVFVDAYRKAYVKKKKLGNFFWSLGGFTVTATIAVVAAVDACGSLPSPESCLGGMLGEGCSALDAAGCLDINLSGCSSLGLLAPAARLLSYVP